MLLYIHFLLSLRKLLITKSMWLLAWHQHVQDVPLFAHGCKHAGWISDLHGIANGSPHNWSGNALGCDSLYIRYIFTKHDSTNSLIANWNWKKKNKTEMNRELSLTVDFYQVAARLNFADDFCYKDKNKCIFSPKK